MYKFTDQNVEAIVKSIQESETMHEACAKVGIPIDTFNHWMQKGKSGKDKYSEFRRVVEKAKKENPVIGGKSWDRRLKYTVSFQGHTGSLAYVAKKCKVRYNIVYSRYMKHKSDPQTYPLAWVFRPVKKAQDSMSSDAIQRDIAKSLSSIADSLERIANFCDREP